ncbi:MULTISPECIES: hemin uptake protein HemP [Bremerella]|uniref:hemin uptake protein HemP n=1 Tax=Bremerella TaxID=2714594 RepID=UPI0031F199DC
MNTSQRDANITSPASNGHENAPAPQFTKRTIQSEEIMAGEKEVWIQHGDAIYRLCETKSGKLILQK